MNKTEMIDAIAEQTGLTKADVTKVLNALVEKTVETVAAGGEFTIIGCCPQSTRRPQSFYRRCY